VTIYPLNDGVDDRNGSFFVEVAGLAGLESRESHPTNLRSRLILGLGR